MSGSVLLYFTRHTSSDLKIKFSCNNTVIILSFPTDRSGQTVPAQIRLILEEQSDQGLNCL